MKETQFPGSPEQTVGLNKREIIVEDLGDVINFLEPDYEMDPKSNMMVPRFDVVNTEIDPITTKACTPIAKRRCRVVLRVTGINRTPTERFVIAEPYKEKRIESATGADVRVYHDSDGYKSDDQVINEQVANAKEILKKADALLNPKPDLTIQEVKVEYVAPEGKTIDAEPKGLTTELLDKALHETIGVPNETPV